MDERDGLPEVDPDQDLRVNDVDRERAIFRVQQAMADGYLEFDEIDQRFAAIYRAKTNSEIATITADLPSAVANLPARRQPMQSFSLSLIGDLKRGGWLELQPKSTVVSLVGDVVIDLSGSSIPQGEAHIVVWQVVGDTKIIVPDGAHVRREIVTVLGHQRETLVLPTPDGLKLTLTVRSLVGDVSVFSLSQVPQGKLQKLWKALRAG